MNFLSRHILNILPTEFLMTGLQLKYKTRRKSLHNPGMLCSVNEEDVTEVFGCHWLTGWEWMLILISSMNDCGFGVVFVEIGRIWIVHYVYATKNSVHNFYSKMYLHLQRLPFVHFVVHIIT